MSRNSPRRGKKRLPKQRRTRKAPHWKRTSQSRRRKRVTRFRSDEPGTCTIANGCITWKIPRKLPSLNRLRTWRARHGDTQAWERAFVTAEILANDLSLGPETCQRLRLEITRLAPSKDWLLDRTNLAGSVKGLEDALVRLRYLVDDSEAWEDGPYVQQGVSEDKKYWTIIRLLEIHDETPTP